MSDTKKLIESIQSNLNETEELVDLENEMVNQFKAKYRTDVENRSENQFVLLLRNEDLTSDLDIEELKSFIESLGYKCYDTHKLFNKSVVYNFKKDNSDLVISFNTLDSKAIKLLFTKYNSRIKESVNSSLSIVSAIPEYTGGGVYTYTGKLSDGNYFMADDGIFMGTDPTFSIRIVDEDPNKVGEDSWHPEWQEEHLVKDIDETEDEGKEFTKQILKWIIKYQPKGNYDVEDMKNMLKVIK